MLWQDIQCLNFVKYEEPTLFKWDWLWKKMIRKRPLEARTYLMYTRNNDTFKANSNLIHITYIYIIYIYIYILGWSLKNNFFAAPPKNLPFGPKTLEQFFFFF